MEHGAHQAPAAAGILQSQQPTSQPRPASPQVPAGPHWPRCPVTAPMGATATEWRLGSERARVVGKVTHQQMPCLSLSGHMDLMRTAQATHPGPAPARASRWETHEWGVTPEGGPRPQPGPGPCRPPPVGLRASTLPSQRSGGRAQCPPRGSWVPTACADDMPGQPCHQGRAVSWAVTARGRSHR